MTNTNSVLTRKQANRFIHGEVLYLFGCQTNWGLVTGAYVITEIRHQSDTGVSFMLQPQFPQLHGAAGTGYQPWANQTRGYFLEFGRTQMLHKISGPPVTYVIQEVPT